MFNYYFLKSKISTYTITNVVSSVTFWTFRIEAKVVGVFLLFSSKSWLSFMAKYHLVEHGRSHFAKYVAFENLADEKLRCPCKSCSCLY